MLISSARTKMKQGVGIKLISLTYRLHCIMEDIWKFGKHFLLHLYIISFHFYSQYGTHVIQLWMKINLSGLFLTEPETRFLWRIKRKTQDNMNKCFRKKMNQVRHQEWFIFHGIWRIFIYYLILYLNWLICIISKKSKLLSLKFALTYR